MWDETVAALNVAVAKRKAHKASADASCVFINRLGRRMVQMTERSHQDYVMGETLATSLSFDGRGEKTRIEGLELLIAVERA